MKKILTAGNVLIVFGVVVTAIGNYIKTIENKEAKSK